MRAKRAELTWGLLFGVVFGLLLHKAGATSYDVILGQFLGRLRHAKDRALRGRGRRDRDPSPAKGGPGTALPERRLAGEERGRGLVFGVGFAVLGYCPGTIAGAIGTGRLDALVGGPGILLRSWLFAVVYPRAKDGLLRKGAFQKITLPELLSLPRWAVIGFLTVLLTGFLYLVERAGL